MGSSLFEVENLQKWYRMNEGILSTFSEPEYLKAVDDVSLTIESGELIGLAGQSGCGKSTLGELLLGLQQPTDGDILFKGENISEFSSSEMKQFRQDCQIVFQDPYESLNPRFTIGRIVAEPLAIHKIGDKEERDARTIKAIEDAGLQPAEKFLDKIPAELSGGERQRVSIARAMVLEPDFLLADEPVSMLDVSVSTEILKEFKQLQKERELTILYISHDLSTIHSLTDRSMIMYLGDIVESGPTDKVIHNPGHPYTNSLIESMPRRSTEPTAEKDQIEGEVPNPVDLPSGCRYRPRCHYATERCEQVEPDLELVDEKQFASCHHPLIDTE